MRVQHCVSEKSGMMGGRSYLAEIRVELDRAEREIISNYGVYTSFEVGERFMGKNGVDVLGAMRLDTLAQGLQAKFNSIQQADDFVLAVLSGLQTVKKQIDLTRDAASRLNQKFEVEI
jgi:hypothetical protein